MAQLTLAPKNGESDLWGHLTPKASIPGPEKAAFLPQTRSCRSLCLETSLPASLHTLHLRLHLSSIASIRVPLLNVEELRRRNAKVWCRASLETKERVPGGRRVKRVSVLSGRGVRNGQQSGLTPSGNFPEVGSDIVCGTVALGLHESWGIRKP